VKLWALDDKAAFPAGFSRESCAETAAPVLIGTTGLSGVSGFDTAKAIASQENLRE
jgi:hypothetical protein